MRFKLAALILALLGGGPSSFAQDPTLVVPPKRWALVIGAGKYDTLGQLRYAPADARAFSKALIQDFKFQPESVTTLTDESDETRPTIANIRASLDGLLKDSRLNKGDLFIFYFSGHGVGTTKGDYLCPTDATVENVAEVGLPVKEVIERFVKAGLRNVLVLTDACRGGEKNTFGQELNKLSAEANIGVMLGCAPGSRSYQWNRMGHGYFTYFLLEAMKNPALRQKETGALWASEIGKWMSGEVSKATEPTESAPQVPAIECDDRRDIMLGAFLPATFDSAQIKQTVERLTAERQAAALSDYASRLFDADRFVECAELLRVVDALGKTEDSDMLMLASSLSFSGRTSEASQWFDRLAKSKESVYRHVAILVDERSADAKAKTEAARALIRSVNNVPAILGYLGLLGAPGTNPYRGTLLKEVIGAPGLKGRAKLFLEGDLAFEEGRLPDAEAKLREALATFGLTPTDTLIRLKLADLLKSKGDFEAHAKLCAEGVKSGEQTAFWRLSQAASLRLYLNRKADAVQLVKDALTEDLTPSQLIDCLGIAGARAEEVAAEIKAQCDRHPRAWEAHTVRFLVDALIEGDIVAGLPQDHAAYKYAEDEIVVEKGFERAFSGIWADWLESGAIPPEIYRDLLIIRSGKLIKLLRKGGDDPDLWWAATVNGIRAFRTSQLLVLYSNRFGGKTLSTTQRVQYALVAFNSADWDTFDQLTERGIVGGDAQNVGWLRALSLVMRGRFPALQALILTLKEPTSDYKPMADALRIYDRASRMKKDAAIQALQSAVVEDPAAKAIIGLGFLRAADLESARPLLEDSISMMNWAFQGLHAHALTQLGLAELKAGNKEVADLIAFAVQMSQPGHPTIKTLPFGDPLKRPGSYSFTGRQIDDDTVSTSVKANWQIDAKGNLKGSINSHALSGIVDAQGNFVGTAQVKGKPWKAIAKVPDKETYAKMEQFKEESQVVFLISPDGERLVFALKPA